ncbi:MAG: nitrite/sulfite reductase [Bryobacteraceae bacterium]
MSDTVAAVNPQAAMEAEYDATVRADIELFREQAQAYLDGRITADEFRGYRLRRGVYSQRQEGVHMIRTKVPGGQLTANQMRQMARVADEFGGGRGHLTTRQNIQYHFVPLARVADLLHMLADARLTTREACYNTVRNVTACPLAGISRDEVFDVNPYARRVAFAFLHRELTDNLPRKFKIAFSGGSKRDTVDVAINDLGFTAVIREENGVEKRGFRVVVGGGLGPLPNEAALLDEFLPEDRIVNRCEAVIRVFNEFGNRKNKNKARLKFVLRERGFDWLKEQIEREYQDILQNGGIPTPESVPENFGGFQSRPRPLGDGAALPVISANGAHDPEYDRWLETNIEEQKQTGYAMVTVSTPQGNLTGAQMRALADIAENAGDGLLRFTTRQNVVLAYIPLANLKRVYAALKMVNLADAGAGEIEDVITCPGAWTCNLGLTKTMNLGAALVEAVRGYTDPRVRSLAIKSSGCPNACGQHWIGDIGFYGNARKIDGKEVPYYQMLLGGGPDEQGIMRFGLAIQSIPARLAPVAVKRVLDHFMANRLENESFRDYVIRHKVETFRQMTADLAKPAELFPELYKDWGDEVDYSLQLGRGECAA